MDEYDNFSIIVHGRKNLFHYNTCTSILYDRTLLFLTIGLTSIGFIMVTSASMPIGARLSEDPFYFAKRDGLYLVLSFFLALGTIRIPMVIWHRCSPLMLWMTIVLLIIVLVAGNSANGAYRWISLGPFRIQPAELSKLTLFCYLAHYMVKKGWEVQTNVWVFLKPISVMTFLSLFLLAQPDFGTVVVLFVTTLALLFLAGAKLWQCLSVIVLSSVSVSILIISAPYRMRRFTSFWNPWENPFGSGYQLTQSLMAFGRGHFWGQGLGNSIQKLEYLPEAHTDFIFAILGEELGYFGATVVLIMVFIVACRAMSIGRNAFEMNQLFSGFLACAIGIWFSFQSLLNVGTTVGLLPTKGLTFPLVSYGGSSLLIMSTSIVLLLRIDFETRLSKVQAFKR